MQQKLSDEFETNFPDTRHPENWQGQDSLTNILFPAPKTKDCREETRLGRNNPADMASHAFTARQREEG